MKEEEELNRADACPTKFEELPVSEGKFQPSSISPPSLELNPLPCLLKYAFLGPDNTYPVVILELLSSDQEALLIIMLQKHMRAIGWTIADLKGISPFCLHTQNIFGG